MFYLVIDLEMCRVPRDYRNKAYHYAYETIQIGAVLLNEEFKQVWTIVTVTAATGAPLTILVYSCVIHCAPYLLPCSLHS